MCVSVNPTDWLDSPIPSHSFHPSVSSFNQATACLGEHAPQFVGEAAFKARLGALVKAVTEHLHSLQARNSARLDARCLGVREALMANATALVRPTAKSTDEKGG